MHEIKPASPVGSVLGGEIQGRSGLVGPKQDRLWRLRAALKWLGSGPKVIGKQVEVIVGHFVFEALFSRGVLFVFRAMYTFIHKSYHSRQVLWDPARREALVAVGLLPLVSSDITRPWSGEIIATDASTSGWGIC